MMFTHTDDGTLQFPWLVRYIQKRSGDLEQNLFKKAFARYLKTAGTALDISSGNSLVALLREKGLTTYAVSGTQKKLLYPDNSFDYLTSCGLLETVPEQDRKRIFSEMIRVTRNMLFVAVRTSGFSGLLMLSALGAPDIFPPSLLSLKEFRALIAKEPGLQLVELRNAGGFEKSFVMAVLQKTV